MDTAKQTKQAAHSANIVWYEPKYFPEIVRLHELHESPTTPFLTEETLPAIGAMAMDEGHIVAAGFLRRVEGGYGQLDTFVTNPGFVSELRHIAIQGVAEGLLAAAKELKLQGIIVLTNDYSIIQRAEATGFQVHPHRVLTIKGL